MKVQVQTVLKREFKARKLTINGVAKSCGVPVSVLHGWCEGVLPSAKNLHHLGTLAKFLNLSISVLLFDQEESESPQVTLFNSEFKDAGNLYKVVVTKVKKSSDEK
ncbi:helix-turn-helix domain-containing protein [Bdellovibrio bacteriovorus]|uniref:helix-turn-helix domain-containing protein n=1 Tax=Bdellovibrio bacteriovorus TaxID=959 RepID=UPI003A806890